MRSYQFIALLFVIAVLTSCNKEEIPTPEVIPPVENNPSLFIRGVFNGSNHDVTIDGESFSAESQFVEGAILEQSGAWNYSVTDMATNSLYMSFFLANHDEDSTIDYEDLVQTTSVQNIQTLINGVSDATNKLHMLFVDSTGVYNLSTTFANTFDVLESKDTLVNNQQYRILEISGSALVMESPDGQVEIPVTDFHARLAFNL